jgi:hypothetical protein
VTRALDQLGEAAFVLSRRTIPFDVAFRYDLTGSPGRPHREVVNVSVEAAFVAVSIGYGVIPAVSAIQFGPPPPPPDNEFPGGLRNVSFGAVIDALVAELDDGQPGGAIGARVAAVLSNGFRLRPEVTSRLLLDSANDPLDDQLRRTMFQAVAAPAERIQFKYAIFDDASGREFQSEPILNVAGLGISNGDRPFRYFARPIRFEPRSAIRMEITEVSEFAGELHVSLQGYKVLGQSGTPTGRPRGAAKRARRVDRMRRPRWRRRQPR